MEAKSVEEFKEIILQEVAEKQPLPSHKLSSYIKDQYGPFTFNYQTALLALLCEYKIELDLKYRLSLPDERTNDNDTPLT